MKRLFIKTILATVAFAAFGAASAQDIKERTIKFATQNPDGHPIVAGMKKFGELVTAKSGGKIKVNLSPAACWVAMPPTCPRCRAARWRWCP